MSVFPSAVPVRLEQLQDLGHVVFVQGLLNLNIVGVRSRSREANQFDDRLEVVYKDVLGSTVWITKSWPITTDPGLTFLEHPARTAGCAILLPGQYRGSHVIGTHHGRYAALVQDRPMRFVRDVNRNAHVDVDGTHVTGVIGINIHAADNNPFDMSDVVRSEVGPWSAGCQVFQSSKDYRDFWRVVVASSRIYGPVFSYTLVEEV